MKLLMTINEVADALGVGRSTAKNLIYSGEIKSVMLGPRLRRVPVSALEDYVRSLKLDD